MEPKVLDVAPRSGLHPEYGLMLEMLQDGTREWREELGCISPDAIVWQPYPNGYSIGAVILHMCDVEVYWIEEFCLGKKMSKEDEAMFMTRQIKQYSGKWPTPPRKPLAYYYAMQDAVRARTIASLKDLPEPSAAKARRKTTLTMRWVLSHVVQHESYHGGQAVLLKELYRRTKHSS